MLCQFLWYNKANQYVYTYPLSLGPPSHPLTPIPPFQVIPEQQAQIPVLFSSFPLAILGMLVYLCQTQSPNSSHPHLPHPVSTCPFFYVCVSIPALQIGSSVPFFQIPHTYVSLDTCTANSLPLFTFNYFSVLSATSTSFAPKQQLSPSFIPCSVLSSYL